MRDLDYWRDFHGPWYGFDHVETARMQKLYKAGYDIGLSGPDTWRKSPNQSKKSDAPEQIVMSR